MLTLTDQFLERFSGLAFEKGRSMRRAAIVWGMPGLMVLVAAARGQTLPGDSGRVVKGENSPPAMAARPLEGEGAFPSWESLRGQVVVVDFWATWCPPCREEIPDYIALQKKYAGKGLVIVGISVDEGGVAAVAPFAKKMGINYPVVLFNDDVVAAFGGIDGIPATFLIDRDGNIRNKQVGYVAPEDYEKRVLKLLQ